MRRIDVGREFACFVTMVQGGTMDSDPKVFRRAMSLLDALDEAGEADQDRLLGAARREDPEVAELAEAIRAREGVEFGPFGLPSGLFEVEDAEEQALPESIGPFRVLGIIGEGAHGIVYRALQRDPQRVVAVKVLRSRIPSDQTRQRFRREADVLGRLPHPNVCAILSARTEESPDGTPAYIAMELAPGQKLSDVAVRDDVMLPERIAIVRKLCNALAYAHGRGVLHRDLKPDNIRVGYVDGRLEPKILDFGIALLLEGDVRSMPRSTLTGQILGTPLYMSPEQFRGSREPTDGRSDLYSLAVLGFEFLCGASPYRAADQDSITHEELRVAVCERPPRTLGEVDETLRGDLSVIFAKALEKDREKRYETVVDFSADLARFLAGEPILARPVSWVERWCRQVSRHPWTAAGVAVAFLSVVLASIGSATPAYVLALGGFVGAVMLREKARRAMGESKRALARAERAKARSLRFREFVTEMLSSADPQQKGKDAKVIDILDQQSEKLARLAHDEPEVAASLFSTLGRTYRALGHRKHAHEHLHAAVDAIGHSPAEMSPDELTTLTWYAISLREIGHAQDAAQILRDVWERRRAILPPGHRDSLTVIAQLGLALSALARREEAEGLLREAYGSLLNRFGADDRDTLISAGIIGNFLLQDGRLDEAEPFLTEHVEGLIAVDGPQAIETLKARLNLAAFLLSKGATEQAIGLLRTLVADHEEVKGRESADTMYPVVWLGRALSGQGEHAEAVRLLRRAVSVFEIEYDPSTRAPVTARASLADALLAGEEVQASLEVTDANARIAASGIGLSDPQPWVQQIEFARALAGRGRDDEASRIAARARGNLERLRDGQHVSLDEAIATALRIEDSLARTVHEDRARRGED